MDEHEAKGVGGTALRPGEAVGPYELLRPLAQGGMGAVWAARLRGSRGFQQFVALKLLLPRPGAGAEAEAMFLDEARIAACIEHPNVGQILDFGEHRGTLYIAMEWIDGAALSRVRTEHARHTGKPLPERWVLHVVASACAGLHAAHELRGDDGRHLSVVHRDVTPQNVMVTFDGFVKLVDFGVAKSAARLCITRSLGTIKGKIAYLSPEQLHGAPLDRRSDIFTLGTVLYTLLTNVHPFRGATDEETLRAIAKACPRPARAIAPHLGADVAALVERCLARDPASRFATAAEVGRALEGAALARGGRMADEELGKLVGGLFPGSRREREAALLSGLGASPYREPDPTPATVRGADADALARRLFAEAEAPRDADEVEIDVDLASDRPGAPVPPDAEGAPAEPTTETTKVGAWQPGEPAAALASPAPAFDAVAAADERVDPAVLLGPVAGEPADGPRPDDDVRSSRRKAARAGGLVLGILCGLLLLDAAVVRATRPAPVLARAGRATAESAPAPSASPVVASTSGGAPSATPPAPQPFAAAAAEPPARAPSSPPRTASRTRAARRKP
jgi:serine/threonine-protein kinase